MPICHCGEPEALHHDAALCVMQQNMSSRTCCAICGWFRRKSSDYSCCRWSNVRLQLAGWGTSCHGALPKIRPRNDRKKKAAFMLAEVLITLGIIGVVAAMTLPTLIANYQKKLVETRLISFYSKINQAYRMSYAENGDTVDWIIADKNYSYQEMEDWLEKYILPYMRHYDVTKCAGLSTGQVGVCVTLPDGSLYWFSIDREGQDAVYFPTGERRNGTRNKFQFQFAKRKFAGSSTRNSLNFIEPYVYNWDGRRESLFTNGTWGCRKGNANTAYCTKLIQLNGWEIPDDYPW